MSEKVMRCIHGRTGNQPCKKCDDEQPDCIGKCEVVINLRALNAEMLEALRTVVGDDPEVWTTKVGEVMRKAEAMSTKNDMKKGEK